MMPVRQIKVEYDKEYDILYMLVDKPAFAEAELLIEDVYIRRDVFSEKINGAIIERYSEKDRNCLLKILPSGLGEYLPAVDIS
ncbi:MAG: hypothetical protein ABIH47_00345 [Candidatus Omnitrophota bacterium]